MVCEIGMQQYNALNWSDAKCILIPVCLAKTQNSQYVDLWPLMTIKNYSV